MDFFVTHDSPSCHKRTDLLYVRVPYELYELFFFL